MKVLICQSIIFTLIFWLNKVFICHLTLGSKQNERIKQPKNCFRATASKMGKTPNNGLNTLEHTKKVFLTANRAKKEFIEAENDKKRKVLEKLLWNLEIENQEIASTSFKMPYETLKKSPKNGDLSIMLTIVNNVRTVFQQMNQYVYVPGLV